MCYKSERVINMDFLGQMIVDEMERVVNGTKDSLNSVVETLTQTPEQFNPTIYNAVKAISENAVLPIAYMLLAMFAMIELWEITNRHNSGHEILPTQPVMLMVKVAVGKIILEKTFLILGAIIEIVNKIILSANNTVSGFLDNSVTSPNFAENISNMKFLDKFLTYISLGPSSQILKVMNILIIVIVYGRMIELYLYTAVAPIPFSMLINNSLSSTGKNFLKNYAAVTLQGVFIIIIVGIYGLIAHAPVGASMFDTMSKSMFFSAVLIFCLFKTSGWAKNVIGG